MAFEPRTPAAQAATPGKKKIKTTKVVNGVETEVEIEVDDVPAGQWPPRASLRLLNHDLPRVDGPVKVSGAARYTHDVRLPGMVYAKLLLSPVPRAKVASLDVDAARRVPGVAHVLLVEEKETRWLGQPVAAVAGETPEAAEDGLRALAARFEPLPWAIDHASAVKEGAPQVANGPNVGRPETDGDEAKAQAALSGAAARVRATYQLPVQHHASLETHGVVVDYRGGDEATVYCSTQYAQGFAADAAQELGLKASAVRGVVEHMGGGFGAKFGLDSQGVYACRIAKELKRPVHLMLDRRAEFLMSGNRSGTIVTLEAGLDASGKLVALVAEGWKHGGLGRGSLAALPYCYTAGAHYRSIRSVRMNLDANRAMRAPGHPQASFAMESILDEVAYAAGLDVLEVRRTNAAHPVWVRQLERVAREIGWNEHPHRTKPGEPRGTECVGIGFGISAWGAGGSDECEAEVRIEKDGSVVVSCAAQDLGTGTRTYMAAIAAEELGRELGQVTARLGDSRLPTGVASGGSVTTPSVAPAVKDASTNARVAFAAHLGKVLDLPAEGFRFTPDGVIHDAAKSPTILSWSKACGTLPAEGLSARGKWQESLQVRGVRCTQAAKVAVDPGTGRVRVLHMVCVQELGLPLNRLAVKSQIQGGMIQALGQALSEGRVVDAALGIQLNPNFEEYKLPHALEIPRMTVILDDEDTRNGVAGVGEPPVIPGVGAIANAVHNAIGARVRELPITPDKVLLALGKVV